jgi:hypothetical protein
MKINFKGIGKAIVAAGTMVGGTLLAFQAKKSLKGEDEFDATLAPLGEETVTEETETEDIQEEVTEEEEA